MALIHELKLTDSERDTTVRQVNYLLKAHQKRSVPRDILERFASEWMKTATRLNKGLYMIEEAQKSPRGNIEVDEHLSTLEDLYLLLNSIFGLYELFFKANMPNDAYQIIYGKVYSALVH